MTHNILFISHSRSISGAERCLLELIERLDRRLYGGLVIVPDGGPFLDKVVSYGWDVQVLPIYWWVALNQRNRWHFRDAFGGMPKRVQKLREIIRRRKIGVVYTNTITCLDGAVSAKLENIAHIWHIHEVPTLQTHLKFYCPMWLVRLIVHSLSKTVVVPSRIVRDDIQYKDSDHIQLIPNGIDLREFSLTGSHVIREEMGVKNGSKIVCMIGALNENKRPVDFIEAARIVLEKVNNVLFMLIGSGNALYVDTIKKKIHELGLAGKVVLLGFRKDIKEILSNSDVLVSASRVESFSLVLLEAMAACKPVVATRSGGPQEIVVDGVTGYLVRCCSPPEMAEAILSLLADEPKARQMGCKGRERVEELYSIEKYFEGMRRIINESLQITGA
jgi:glycosyltransferase involved in cell wall biosynthesis